MNRLRAYTLIEMLLVIVIGSTLAAISVLLLISLLKSQHTGREHFEYSRTITRLGEQFRGDIHAAADVINENNPLRIELLPKPPKTEKICYQCYKDHIDRLVSENEKILGRESYFLPEAVEASIQVQRHSGASFVGILLSSEAQWPKTAFAAPTRIDAMLGLDSRLSSVRSTSNKQDAKTPPPKNTPANPPTTESHR
ncbi:MAG: prepilin-type N-terminal cleavage/methylation domain-containing protein [Thermoguttaceae bacterium]